MKAAGRRPAGWKLAAAVMAMFGSIAGALAAGGPSAAAVGRSAPPAAAAAGGELLRVDFNAIPPGPASAATVRTAFTNANGTTGVDRIGALDAIVEEGGERFYRKTMPGGTCCYVAHGTGFAWRMKAPRTELYLSYRVRFATGFDGRRGGKLPGLCGGTCNIGGRVPTGTGWSARGMWLTDPATGVTDTLVQYVYHLGQAGQYGEPMPYQVSAGRYAAEAPQWQRIEHHIVMNAPGRADGVAQAWVDGVEVLKRTDIRYRTLSTVAIDRLLFQIFFGGHDGTWAPTRDEWIDIDDVVVSTQRITAA